MLKVMIRFARLGADRRAGQRGASMNDTPELAALVAEYRAGLDVEIVPLHRIENLAGQQRDASRAGDIPLLTAVSDQRDRVMASLVTLENQLKPMRLRLAEE